MLLSFLVPKKSPPCHNSSGSTMKKVSSVCHIWPHLFMQVCSPKWKGFFESESSARESYPPSSKLVDMHANCRISARKPGHETLKEIETSYKTSRDTTFGRMESTHEHFQMVSKFCNQLLQTFHTLP